MKGLIGDIGLGGKLELEFEVLRYRASMFFKLASSFYREAEAAGFEKFLSGLKIAAFRTNNDSIAFSCLAFAEIPALDFRKYLPNTTYNIGMSMSLGVPWRIAMREFAVFGTDFDSNTRLFNKTEAPNTA